MATYKEIRRISAPVLRELCTRHDWYTAGDNSEYDHLLQDLAAGKPHLGTADIVAIAEDIAAHSDLKNSWTAWTVEAIAFEVARACTVTFVPVPVPDAASGLPETCYSVLPGTGALICIKRGEAGYYPSVWDTGAEWKNREIADRNNKRLGVTQAQRLAMEIGSMCGWDAPGADPKAYEREPQGDM